MAKTKLFFDVKDNEYFARLQQYILANYGMYFEIIDEGNNDPETYTVSDYVNRRNKKDVFLIKEQKGDISKFRGASEICSALMKMNNSESKNTMPTGTAGPVFFCVTSAAGGTGKTTIAQAMCCSLALKGRNVLYMNFNPFSSNEYIFTESDRNSLTRLRYYLKKTEGDIAARIKSLVSRNIERRIDFIVNEAPSADGFISKEETLRMIRGLICNQSYDSIVFDIPSYPGEGHIEIMKQAVKNLLIYSGEPDNKHSAFRKFLEAKGVNHIIDVTNFSGSGENPVPRADDIFSTHPEAFWKAVSKLCELPEGKNEKRN